MDGTPKLRRRIEPRLLGGVIDANADLRKAAFELDGAIRWFFRDGETGEITIAQAPNFVLWIVIVAGSLFWIWPTAGKVSGALMAVFKVGLMIWAADEIVRGVNPWRRSLRAAVAIYELTTVL